MQTPEAEEGAEDNRVLVVDGNIRPARWARKMPRKQFVFSCKCPQQKTRQPVESHSKFLERTRILNLQSAAVLVTGGISLRALRSADLSALLQAHSSMLVVLIAVNAARLLVLLLMNCPAVLLRQMSVILCTHCVFFVIDRCFLVL
jgi:hypothetical protein